MENRDRADLRSPAEILAAIPWPSDAERIKDQVRRAFALSSEERFRAQLALLALVDPDPAVRAAGKRWHDRQEAIKRERLQEVFERHADE